MSKWKIFKMDDLIDEISMGPFGSDIKVSCFVEKGIPVLNGSNLFGTRLKEDSFRYVTPEKADSLKKANACRGDVIVTHRGTLGQIVYIPQNSTLPRYVISQSQFRFRCNDKVIPEYVVNYFHSHEGQNKILANASQVGVPALARASSSFRDIEIPLPPLPTQRKIAAVLSSLDDKIENNRKICANLEAQAQAIFKSWFVDFEPFGGKMPQGWKTGKLGDVAEITMGQSPDGKSLNDVDDGITFFQGRAEFGNRYPTKRLSTTEPKRMAKEGDVLLSVRAPVGDLNIALENCCIGRGLAAIRAKTECADQDVARPPRPCGKGEGALATSRRCQSFIYCLLRSMKPQFDLYEGAGTIFGSINKDSLHGLSCLVPDDKALQEFEGVVSSFDSLYRERELESRSLAALRDALLPKLMSGEIDVEKVEVA